MRSVLRAHASLAPIRIVTCCGRSPTAFLACAGRSRILAPLAARFQLWEAGLASTRAATLATERRLPVAHDSSGQSVRIPQASKARVMESPEGGQRGGAGVPHLRRALHRARPARGTGLGARRAVHGGAAGRECRREQGGQPDEGAGDPAGERLAHPFSLGRVGDFSLIPTVRHSWPDAAR